MAPVIPTRGLSIPRTPNTALLSAARSALSEAVIEARTDLLPTAARAALVRRASLSVTSDAQKITIGVICGYIVAIALLWNIPYVRNVLWPFKMLTIAFHEFGHALACKLTGGHVEGLGLDPREGGVTHMRGGKGAVTLPAGYLGSSLIGALLTFCGFDIVASKIASFVCGVVFLWILWWGLKSRKAQETDGNYKWLIPVTILPAVGLLVACWFIADAEALRFVILFIGVMSSLYSAWDICDDLILRKVHSSDASQFALRYGGSSQCWGVIWSIISLCFMVAGILCGILAFPETTAEQKTDSDNFIDSST